MRAGGMQRGVQEEGARKGRAEVQAWPVHGGWRGTGHFDRRMWFRPVVPAQKPAAPWLKSPVPPAGSRGRRERRGRGSCEVCGLGCEAHTIASPDTCYEGACEPPIATSPLPVSFSALPESPPTCPPRGPEHRPPKWCRQPTSQTSDATASPSLQRATRPKGWEGRKF